LLIAGDAGLFGEPSLAGLLQQGDGFPYRRTMSASETGAPEASPIASRAKQLTSVLEAFISKYWH
jgi:hypothetical protein